MGSVPITDLLDVDWDPKMLLEEVAAGFPKTDAEVTVLEPKIDLLGAEEAASGEGALEGVGGSSLEETVLLLVPRPKTLVLEAEDDCPEIEKAEAAGLTVLDPTTEKAVVVPVADETTLLAPPMPKMLEVVTAGLGSVSPPPSFDDFCPNKVC